MTLSRRQSGWIVGLAVLAAIIGFLIYPFALSGTIFALIFQDIEITVVVVLFAGMFFMLALLLYVGNQ
jgi:hypothetical protein